MMRLVAWVCLLMAGFMAGLFLGSFDSRIRMTINGDAFDRAMDASHADELVQDSATGTWSMYRNGKLIGKIEL